jgi:F-type H+-transporting ATPase subunit epsilon
VALQVELVSPERILFSGEADSVSARTTGGDITFLTGHAPFLGVLGIGAVTVRLADGTEEVAAVHGGFVEVNGESVIILSDVAELSSQIDVARAEARLAELQRGDGEDDADERAQALRRQQVRIDVAGRA